METTMLMDDPDEGGSNGGGVQVNEETNLETRLQGPALDAAIEESREQIKAIVSKITNADGNITESDPAKLEQAYKQIEYTALTAGKTGLAKVLTAAMIQVGIYTLPKAIEATNRSKDQTVRHYRQVSESLDKQLAQIGREKVTLETKQYQCFQLDDLLQKQEANLKQRLGELEKERGEAIVSGNYDAKTQERVQELGEKIEGIKLEHGSTQDRQIQNAQQGINIKYDVDQKETQYEDVRDNQKTVQSRMYMAMRRTSPIIYMLDSLGTLKTLKDISSRMSAIETKNKRFQEAAGKIQDLYMKSIAAFGGPTQSLELPGRRQTSPEKDAYRERTEQYGTAALNVFRSMKRNELSAYKAQAMPSPKPAEDIDSAA